MDIDREQPVLSPRRHTFRPPPPTDNSMDVDIPPPFANNDHKPPHLGSSQRGEVGTAPNNDEDSEHDDPPPRRGQHQLTRSVLPKGKGSQLLKNALQYFIRLLMGHFDTRQAPPSASTDPAQKEAFRATYRSRAHIQRDWSQQPVHANLRSNLSYLRQRDRLARLQNKGANQLNHISGVLLQYAANMMSRLNLHQWLPDLEEESDSLYNWAHRYICLEMFRRGVHLQHFGYFGVDAQLVSDDANTGLLEELYDNYVHHYLKKHFLQDFRNPGSVAMSAEQHSRQRQRRSVSSFMIFRNHLTKPKRRLPMLVMIGQRRMAFLDVF